MEEWQVYDRIRDLKRRRTYVNKLLLQAELELEKQLNVEIESEDDLIRRDIKKAHLKWVKCWYEEIDLELKEKQQEYRELKNNKE